MKFFNYKRLEIIQINFENQASRERRNKKNYLILNRFYFNRVLILDLVTKILNIENWWKLWKKQRAIN